MTISIFNTCLERGYQGLTQEGKRTALSDLAAIVAGVVMIALVAFGAYCIVQQGLSVVIPLWFIEGFGLVTSVLLVAAYAHQLFGGLSDENIKKFIAFDPNNGKPLDHHEYDKL